MGVVLGIVNILLGLSMLWYFHRFQQLFCRCQHPPKITGHYPMSLGLIISGALCIAVCLLTRGQNEMLDAFVWLVGLIILMFLPQKSQLRRKTKTELNTMNDTRAFYAKCFKSYVHQKQLNSILQFILLLIYLGLVIICPTYLIINGLDRFGLKSLFALIFPAIWAAFFFIACLSYSRYWRATTELAKGKTAQKTGYITKIRKNCYALADALPPANSNKRPKYSKPAFFHIPPGRRRNNFKPGDKITVIYACSRELNIYDKLHLAAICAFPGAIDQKKES